MNNILVYVDIIFGTYLYSKFFICWTIEIATFFSPLSSPFHPESKADSLKTEVRASQKALKSSNSRSFHNCPQSSVRSHAPTAISSPSSSPNTPPLTWSVPRCHPHCSTNTPSKFDLWAFTLHSPLEVSLPCVLMACSLASSFRLSNVLLKKLFPSSALQHSLLHLHSSVFFHRIVYHPICITVFGFCLLIHIECKLSEGRDLYYDRPSI